MQCYNHAYGDDVRAVEVTTGTMIGEATTRWAWWCEACRDEAMQGPADVTLVVHARVHATQTTRR